MICRQIPILFVFRADEHLQRSCITTKQRSHALNEDNSLNVLFSWCACVCDKQIAPEIFIECLTACQKGMGWFLSHVKTRTACHSCREQERKRQKQPAAPGRDFRDGGIARQELCLNVPAFAAAAAFSTARHGARFADLSAGDEGAARHAAVVGLGTADSAAGEGGGAATDYRSQQPSQAAGTIFRRTRRWEHFETPCILLGENPAYVKQDMFWFLFEDRSIADRSLFLCRVR